MHDRTRWLWWCGAGAAAFLVACESKLPDPDEGHIITGDVFYGGSAAVTLQRPVLQVAAFAEFPPKGPPRAVVVLEVPAPGSRVAYTLRNVPESSYKVVASIVDLDNASATMLPSGGFPNMCAVLFSPAANVKVVNDGAVEDVDIIVYDGGNDPCFSAPRPVDAGMVDIDAGMVDIDAGAVDAPILLPDAPRPDAAGSDARAVDAAAADGRAVDAG